LPWKGYVRLIPKGSRVGAAGGVVMVGIWGEGEGRGGSEGAREGEGEIVGEGEGVAAGVALALGVARSIVTPSTSVSGNGSGVAEGVASGITSGGIISADCVVEKISSRLRRGSSGLGAGVLAE